MAANRGRRHTEESRRKMSEANKGRIFSEELRQKLTRKRKGKPNCSIRNRWTPEEGELLRTLPLKEVMGPTGQGKPLSIFRRKFLGITGSSGDNGKIRERHYPTAAAVTILDNSGNGVSQSG